jgi:murein DD-endopeptidase MepM/ murein hydrolase activator NlpD
MLPYLLQFAVLAILPLLFIVSLWRSREADRCRWLLKALYTGAFIAYLFVMGRWDFSSLYLRYVFAVLYIAAVAKSFFAVKDLPFLARNDAKPKWIPYAAPVILLVFFAAFLGWAVRGYFYSEPAVELQLPLRNGWFYVGQGGNGIGINYHNPNKAQRYALDIVALNESGSRARGLYPHDLTRYVIYGMPVYSPCDGRIAAAVTDFPDLVPPNADPQNVAGNHVVISCAGVLVLLAHLQEGSVLVQTGDAIAKGTVVGAVGNSGNTSEPHLHMHAVRAGSGDILRGEGVPVVFDGTFPVRNTTFR